MADPGFPLHRLNSAHTALWWNVPGSRLVFASKMVKLYPGTGVGILNADLYLIACIEPTGKVRQLPFPWRQFGMWQVANAPRQTECACRHYYYPESCGPWGDTPMAAKGEHHPFCQFRKGASVAYERAEHIAAQRAEAGMTAQQRPDEWLDLAREAEQ